MDVTERVHGGRQVNGRNTLHSLQATGQTNGRLSRHSNCCLAREGRPCHVRTMTSSTNRAEDRVHTIR